MSPRTRRRLIVLAVLAAIALPAFFLAGRLLVRVDPLERADVIYVLGGSRVDRWLDGALLYREGYAPTILVSAGGREPGEVLLDRQGIHVPNEAEIGREVMTTRMGIPPAAVEILQMPVDNTAQEAEAIAPVAASRGWHRLIVITDLATTRRAGYAFRRALGPGVTIIARGTRLDDYNPSRWWARRDTFRTTFYEFPKLVAYWLGLRGS